jgi:outer membrane protein OmpA-like peptidoglycan-associated protein
MWMGEAMRTVSSALAIVALVSTFGCQTNSGTVMDKKATKGALLGTLAGAAAGAAIGGPDHRAGGALIGAATGAVAGGLIGHYLDKQAEELDAIPGASVQRRDDSLLVNFDADLLFDSGAAGLYAGSYDRLRQLSRTLVKYPKSDVIVKGHTDSVGEESYNQSLSEKRADNVRSFLIAEGVTPGRITAIGFGESIPVATNSTAEGRQRNRRVEIEVRPYDEVMRGEQTQ